MVSSKAATVADYLKELPADRRTVVAAVRKLIRKNLPKGYRETMNWGMISYEIPLSKYPNTYNGQPLSYVALAAQKNHFGLYMMCLYGNSPQEKILKEAYARLGKKLDMGKCCVRFRKLEDLPLDVIGRIVASTSPDEYIAIYEKSRGNLC